MLLFKVLDKDGRTYRGYQYDPLPAPGVVLPAVDDVELCAAGYHAAVDPTKWRGSIPYADVRIWLVELGGKISADNQKVAASEMRWVQELHGDWSYLSLFPAAKAMLAAGWRAENPEGDWPSWANLARADLTRAYLTGADLAGANLTGADLTGANLAGANLARADLTGADLTGANLAGANLTDADLTRAYLTDAYLADAYLAGADLTGADLTGADLARADLTGANLTDADLTRAYLTRAYLTRADLAGANLAGANLAGAYLASAYLDDWERGDDGMARRKTPVAT